jgi:hypothetical protein
MSAGADIPLVGPGNELQLTIDGGAVPHAEVVAAAERPAGPSAGEPRTAAPATLPGQTSLTG